jgi:hypothetical protein
MASSEAALMPWDGVEEHLQGLLECPLVWEGVRRLLPILAHLEARIGVYLVDNAFRVTDGLVAVCLGIFDLNVPAGC